MRPLAALIALAAVLGLVPSAALADAGTAAAKPVPASVCPDPDLSVAGKRPGDLLAPPQDVTAQSGLAAGVGRLYRVAYATTGQAGSVTASCGLVALPTGATSVRGVIAWSHGTIGLMEKCQPSQDPAGFVGPMPGGIGSPTKKGPQSDGALYGMLRDGYAVVATDYPSAGVLDDALQSYVLGVLAGVAAIDSARTLTGNPATFGLSPIAADAGLPLLTWGHSQGGHTALWAGQLARPYLAARGDRTLNLVGVAAEAPASQFTTSPGQPAEYMGRHLGDRDMYNMAPGLGVPFPIGVALFSFVTVSWSQLTNATAGEFPVGPTPSVDYRAVLSADGAATAPDIARCCLKGTGILEIAGKAGGYLDPYRKRLFAPPFAGRTEGGLWKGGIDATCAAPEAQPAAFAEWCRWLQFNMPGPNGVNPYPKLPRDNAGVTVPLYIAQGRDDRIIWCVDGAGPVQGANCLTAQYAQSIRGDYCDGVDYLEIDYFPGVGHLAVPGAAATNPSGSGYRGSPLDRFVQGAMTGSLGPRCSVDADATT